MISVETALNILKTNVSALKKSEIKSVSEALGDVLYKDVLSPINMPPFAQSAMDGFALNIHQTLEYKIIGQVKAGDNHEPQLNKGEAIRIFTGAAVPESANAVIMQEKTLVSDNILTIEQPIASGTNIRKIGEQTKQGDIALKKGTKLTPASVGFLNSLGITQVSVNKKPKIAILVTGNELIDAGKPLMYGQMYESNGIMLKTALLNLGYLNISVYKVKDDYSHTLKILEDIITNHDVILVSGGISVGDYDFVGKALKELNVEQLFYEVKQKPGKPLFLGKKEGKIIFALPGNPAASLSCFYIYVITALQLLSGDANFCLNRITAKLDASFEKKGDRAQFLKAIYKNDVVTILDGQSSSMLHTFSVANALIYVPENKNEISINEPVEVILLPIM